MIQGQKTVLSPAPSSPTHQVAWHQPASESNQHTSPGSRERGECRNCQANKAPPFFTHCAQPLRSGPSALPLPSRQQLPAPLKTKGENLSVFLDHSISHKAIISIFPFLCKSGHTQLAWPALRLACPPSPASPRLALLPCPTPSQGCGILRTVGVPHALALNHGSVHTAPKISQSLRAMHTCRD